MNETQNREQWQHVFSLLVVGRGGLPRGYLSMGGICLGGVCPERGGVCIGGGVCLERGGVCLGGVHLSPVDRILDTHLWKHYLSTTSFADGLLIVSDLAIFDGNPRLVAVSTLTLVQIWTRVTGPQAQCRSTYRHRSETLTQTEVNKQHWFSRKSDEAQFFLSLMFSGSCTTELEFEFLQVKATSDWLTKFCSVCWHM